MQVSHCFERLFDIGAVYAPRGFVPIDNTPICLEIGAGKGKHAVLFAIQNPTHQLYAIERTINKFTAFDKIARQRDLTNLHPIHADAIAWTTCAVFPNQIEQCFILYPNPEPKNKNQRFLNMPFFEFLLSRMQVGGKITLASNIMPYIDEAVGQLEHVWRLPYVVQEIDPSSARTHFEIKYLARGERCRQLVITKPSGYITHFDDQLPVSALG